MTQYFTYEGFTLHDAPLQIRVLATAFLVMVTLGITVGLVNYQVRTGLTAEGSAAWYRGGPAAEAGPAAASDVLGGASDAPGGTTELHAKSPLELLDATHPHLFNQAFLFFVLGHLLALCAVTPGVKIAVYLGGFAGVLLDTASPWLIRYLSPHFAWLQLAGHVLMALAFAALVWYPLRDMWRPPELAGS